MLVLLKTWSLPVRRQDHTNRQASIDDVDPFAVQDFQLKASIL